MLAAVAAAAGDAASPSFLCEDQSRSGLERGRAADDGLATWAEVAREAAWLGANSGCGSPAPKGPGRLELPNPLAVDAYSSPFL